MELALPGQRAVGERSEADMSGFGDKAINLAANIADGYISVLPNRDFVRLCRDAGGGNRPVRARLARPLPDRGACVAVVVTEAFGGCLHPR